MKTRQPFLSVVWLKRLKVLPTSVFGRMDNVCLMMISRSSWLGEEGVAPLGLAVLILLTCIFVCSCDSCGRRPMQGILRVRSGPYEGYVVSFFNHGQLGVVATGTAGVKLDFVPVGSGSCRWYVSRQGSYLWVNCGNIVPLPDHGAVDHRMDCEFKPFNAMPSGVCDPKVSSVGCLQRGVPYLIYISKGQYLTVNGNNCIVANDINHVASFQIEAEIEVKQASFMPKPLLALSW